MKALSRRIDNNTQTTDTPFIFTLIQRCIVYGISYELMKRLKYEDLLALVIEFDIKKVKEVYELKEEQRQARRGLEVKKATNDEILKMHRRR